MAEDFAAIAAEADAEIRANGFACTIWKQTDGPKTPWQTVPETYDLHEIFVISSTKLMRDRSGFLIGQTMTTLTTGTVAVAIAQGDRIAIGKALADAEPADPEQWSEITTLREVAPGGVPLLYKIDMIK